MDFDNQYKLIRSSRHALLDYCATISPKHFVEENSSFGRDSIRNLLVHNAYTYEYWLGVQALEKVIPVPDYNLVRSLSDVLPLFKTVDDIVEAFNSKFSGNFLDPIKVSLRENVFDATPLELFTHVISHEFHHKGQILSLSRHLGYIPVDTDVIR